MSREILQIKKGIKHLLYSVIITAPNEFRCFSVGNFNFPLSMSLLRTFIIKYPSEWKMYCNPNAIAFRICSGVSFSFAAIYSDFNSLNSF